MSVQEFVDSLGRVCRVRVSDGILYVEAGDDYVKFAADAGPQLTAALQACYAEHLERRGAAFSAKVMAAEKAREAKCCFE